jgi:hypothetical protein
VTKRRSSVISDGGDNASESTRREMLDLTERSIATIYAIGLYDADDPDRAPGILRQLAKISGGEAYFPENPSGMTSICRGIARRHTDALHDQPCSPGCERQGFASSYSRASVSAGPGQAKRAYSQQLSL